MAVAVRPEESVWSDLPSSRGEIEYPLCMHVYKQRWQCDMLNRKHLFATQPRDLTWFGIQAETRVIFHSAWRMYGRKSGGSFVHRRHLTWSMFPIYLESIPNLVYRQKLEIHFDHFEDTDLQTSQLLGV